MKLAKKMLVSVLALAMVAALALTAFAAAPVISMSANEAVVGETITVNVSVDQWVGFESADLIFNYDADALEFVSIAQTGDYNLGDGDKVADGEVTWSFFYTKAAEADNSTAICALTFKVLAAVDSEITVTVDSWDGTDTATANALTVSAKEPSDDPEPTTKTPDPTTAPTEPESKTDAPKEEIPQTSEAGIAVIAGVMAIAAVAFVATRKKDEQ